jgi:anti-anti-sigma regulatory factor
MKGLFFELQGADRLEFLLLDMTPIHHVDSMGLHFLEDLVFSMRAKGITLGLANPNHKVTESNLLFPIL